ncbi:hypothetical protein GG344DRAFT_71465 [Lentinula edodes]|nr:hypothetical protein GG344DRAFT_71465 [Lentinula edodes]
MFVAAGMDPDNENKIRGYGFHVGKDVHGQPFFRAIPDYTERVLRPFLNFASAAFVAEDNPSTTSLSTSADRDTSEVANSPPLTVVADGSESLPVSSEHPAGASPTACATESMSEITTTPIAPSHDTSIGLTDPPSDILPTLSSPFPILSSPMPTSSFPLDNCGELPVMPTSPTLPTPTVSSAILGTPPVVVTPSCQPMTRSLSYPLIPFQPEEQSSHSTRSLSLPPPSSADVSLSLLLGDSSTARAVDQLPEPVSQAPQSYSWSRMTDHEFDAVIATGLNNNQLFEWDSTGALPELNQPVGPLIGEKTGSVDSGLSNIEGVDGGLLAFPFGSVASIAGPPTLSPPIVGNSRLAFPSAQDINTLLSTTSNVFDTEVPDPLIVKSTVDTGNDMSSLGNILIYSAKSHVLTVANPGPMVPDSLFAGSIIQVGAPSVLSPSCVTSSSSSSDPPMGNTQTSPAHSDGDGLLDMLVHPSSSDPPIGDTQMSPAHSDGTILVSTSNSNVPTGGAPTGPARAPTSSLKAPTGGVPTGPALLAAMLAKEPALLSSLDADHPDIFVDGMSTDVAAEITTGANAKDKAAGSQRKQAQKKDTTAAKSKKGTKVISKPPVEEKANEKSSNSGSGKIVVGESGKIKIVFGSGESAKGDMSNLGDGGGAMKENTLPSTMERSARPQRSHKEAPSREPITIKEMNIRRMATKRSVHEAGLNVDSDSSKKAKQV